MGHELFHGYEANFGIDDSTPINGLGRKEWRATYYENLLRITMNIHLRTYYNNIYLLDNNGNPINQPAAGEKLINTLFKKF